MNLPNYTNYNNRSSSSIISAALGDRDNLPDHNHIYMRLVTKSEVVNLQQDLKQITEEEALTGAGDPDVDKIYSKGIKWRPLDLNLKSRRLKEAKHLLYRASINEFKLSRSEVNEFVSSLVVPFWDYINYDESSRASKQWFKFYLPGYVILKGRLTKDFWNRSSIPTIVEVIDMDLFKI